MFLKPLLVSAHDGTEYSRASYRHVMIRNVVCTVGIAVTYAITTVVVVVGISNASSPEGNIKVLCMLVRRRLSACGPILTLLKKASRKRVETWKNWSTTRSSCALCTGVYSGICFLVNEVD